MKKFLGKYWEILLIIGLSLLTAWPLFVPGYFSHHDDLQVMRIFEMRKCFADLQIPCRWVPDMGYGNGYPLFNFYGVFPYYVGAIASYVLGFIGAAKFLFFLPLIFGGVGMYLLAKELFGKFPGLTAAALYIFAPYRALDTYVRGAIGESFALGTIPFVFYFAYKKNFWGLTLTLFIFLTSHNIMTLIFTPFIIIWILYWWKGSKKAILALILGFGLASFFILPAFFEKNLVQTESLTRAELDFRSQFVKVSQLFIDRSWNYAGSAPLSSDTISYQIGWPHWWLVVLALFTFPRRVAGVLFLIFTFGVFMTHNKSAPVWESIKILSFVQFPWRFLSIVVFAASLLGGYFTSASKEKWKVALSVIIVILTIGLNWQYFRPEHFYKDVTDEVKLSGQNFIDQQKGALLDYLPKTAVEPRELALKPENFILKSKHWELKVNLKNDSVVEVPVFDFPGWSVNYPKNLGTIGRIAVSVPKGEHVIIGKFRNTPIRTFANSLTLISFLSLTYIYAKDRKIFG